MRTFVAVCLFAAALMAAEERSFAEEPKEQLIWIVGTTLDERDRIVGTITHLIVTFEKRSDSEGLIVYFKKYPGSFSKMAQTATEQAIIRAAKAMDVSPDSWTVTIASPSWRVTIYGDSLSAMVGITVIAMAKGEYILSDHVMTGTITPDGKIGMVSAVPLKVVAAHQAHLSRILIPEEHDPTDFDWETPFLMQVSPVGTVQQAYKALTTHAGERSER